MGLCLLLGAGAAWQALAANTTFTYQGRVTVNGTNFSGTGMLKFALVTSESGSSQATATANLTGSFVTSCTVDFGGSGYTSAPAVSFSGGGGSGAVATAVVTGGQVTDIVVILAGVGYTNAPDVIIAPPPSSVVFTTFWSNDGTSVDGSEPATAVSVPVSGGLFTMVLGDTTQTNMAAINDSVFGQPNLQLRIWFNDGVHGSAVLSPLQDLTPVPYATIASAVSGQIPLSKLPPQLSLLNAYGSLNFFAGGNAGNQATSGGQNAGVGNYALAGNISGYNNSAFGYSALAANTNGSANSAFGAFALRQNRSGQFNVAIGYSSMLLTTTGSYNTAVGVDSLYNNNGSHNSAFGDRGLYYNTIGTNNVSSGAEALFYNTTGNNNTALGYQALHNNVSGSGNIVIGQAAGSAISTGGNNILIGNAGFADESNVIRIGTSQTKAVMLGIYGMTVNSGTPVYVNPSGLLGTATSSARFKRDIQSMGDTSEAVLSLRPVTFRYKEDIDPEGQAQFGLIAEEVEKVDPDLVVRDDKRQLYSVRYEAVNAMLLNEFLKEHRTVQAQEARIEALERKLDQLQEAVTALSSPK